MKIREIIEEIKSLPKGDRIALCLESILAITLVILFAITRHLALALVSILLIFNIGAIFLFKDINE
jgi:hypothetical protein